MDKNINNIIFGIPSIMSEFVMTNNKHDDTFESLAKFILSINENDKDTNIYFIVDQVEKSDSNNNSLDENNCQRNNIKDFLKNYKIKIRENNIKFVLKKTSSNQVLDVDASIDDVVYIEDEQDISPDNTVVIFSDSKFGEVAFLDDFFCVAICSDTLKINFDLKEFQKISNKIINLSKEEITLDSLNYDFLTFNESH